MKLTDLPEEFTNRSDSLELYDRIDCTSTLINEYKSPQRFVICYENEGEGSISFMAYDSLGMIEGDLEIVFIYDKEEKRHRKWTFGGLTLAD